MSRRPVLWIDFCLRGGWDWSGTHFPGYSCLARVASGRLWRCRWRIWTLDFPSSGGYSWLCWGSLWTRLRSWLRIPGNPLILSWPVRIWGRRGRSSSGIRWGRDNSRRLIFQLCGNWFLRLPKYSYVTLLKFMNVFIISMEGMTLHF